MKILLLTKWTSGTYTHCALEDGCVTGDKLLHLKATFSASL